MDARNEVVLYGPVKGAVSLKTTKGGSLCVIDVNTDPDHQIKMKGTYEDHRVVCWGELAEKVYRTVRDGDWVLAEGRMQTRSWQNREGNWMRTTEVVAVDVNVVEKKAGLSPLGEAEEEAAAAAFAEHKRAMDNEPLPF
jgi:single-strand DNA-binding protein